MTWTKRLASGFLLGLCHTTINSQALTSAQREFPEIRITISESQFNRLKSNRGIKMELKKVILLLDNDTAAVKELHARGLTSLQFERKSLAVDLDREVELKSCHQKVKRFDLVNLEMDHHLWHNRWAFLSLSDLELFPLFNTFCKVWINGHHQGIYLLVEKPNYYMDKVGSPYMIRRGYDHKVDKAYSKSGAKDEIKALKDRYESIYDDLAEYHGETLFNKLSQLLVLDHYFEWLGFNYWVMNGDYSDELFLYHQPASGLFDIIPWDYDDIFKRQPHEGWANRNPILADKMIFSTEETLDLAIGSDDFLYSKYLGSMKRMVLAQSPERVKATMNQVVEELSSLAHDQEAANASRYLDKIPFDLSEAQNDVAKTYDFLLARRIAILEQLSGK